MKGPRTNMAHRKLSTDEVIVIREAGEEYARLKREMEQLSAASLARKFEVCSTTIAKIQNRDIYKEI